MSLIRALLVFAFVVAGPRIADACILDGVNPVVFGDYDVFSNADVQAVGGVRYHCILGLQIRIELSTGSGTYAARKMTRTLGGSDTLSYQLFVDSARTQVFGNGQNGTYRYGPYIGLLDFTTVPVYATLYKKQNVQTGAYSDTITVTFNY